MSRADARRAKFEKYRQQTLFDRLDAEDQICIREIAGRYSLTFQELRQVCEGGVDLEMWREKPLHIWWKEAEEELEIQGQARKERLLKTFRAWLGELRSEPKRYPAKGLGKPESVPLERVVKHSERKVIGMCPVASEETVCCNLQTIDAVENCGFGCSYCTIQTFYDRSVSFDPELPEKLLAIELDPERFYHIGTGQSSDALMWGNQHGLLDGLCDFARQRPNVLLEFKTKAKNVAYFLKNEVPANLFLSWSLNTPTIIDNEEHFTADLEERLGAARQVADAGLKVAFHFHPIVYYEGWEEEYTGVIERVVSGFSSEEVLFVSLGTVTFIKPVTRAIRERGWQSKILQMELVPGAKGKLTYPDSVKEQLFDLAYDAFSSWHEKVFFYLCMEPAPFWESTFGRVYAANEEFERDMIGHMRTKLGV
jgi:spore photoproduct lyase